MSPDRDYTALVERVRACIRETVPQGARALVISRGDGTLLQVEGRQLEHFPQTATGLYAGHHPADGGEAAHHLTELRARGAEYLVVPATALWWLDHYEALRLLLEGSSTLVAGDRETCLVFRLAPANAEAPAALDYEAARTVPQVAGLLGALLPDEAGVVLVGRSADCVEVTGLRISPVPAPRSDTRLSVSDALARIRAATGDGARYVVLMHSARAREHLDGRLRRELDRTLRPVCSQRLADIYEVV